MLNDKVKEQARKQMKGLKQQVDTDPEEARDAFVSGLDIIGNFADGLAGDHDKTSHEYKQEIMALNLALDEDREELKRLMDEYVDQYFEGDM